MTRSAGVRTLGAVAAIPLVAAFGFGAWVASVIEQRYARRRR